MNSNIGQFARVTLLVSAVAVGVLSQPPIEERLDYPIAFNAAERLKTHGVRARVVSCNIASVCVEAIEQNRWKVEKILESGTIVLVNSADPLQCLKVPEKLEETRVKPESCT